MKDSTGVSLPSVEEALKRINEIVAAVDIEEFTLDWAAVCSELGRLHDELIMTKMSLLAKINEDNQW